MEIYQGTGSIRVGYECTACIVCMNVCMQLCVTVRPMHIYVCMYEYLNVCE